MATRLEKLNESTQRILNGKLVKQVLALDELTIECKAADLIEVCTILRDDPELKFEQLIDLCGVDYSDYRDGTWEGQRYATVYHLLSVSLNHRIRLKVFAEDDTFPVLKSAVDVWSVANWFERESFDLYGIMYEGHPDLRRILTDYGFVGHVEMRYDPAQQRVVYQPVSIELRNNVPRVIRDEGFHNG